jgi:hypothetical protein
MEFVHYVMLTNISKMGFVKIVLVVRFMISNIKNVFVMKLKIIIGTISNVFSVIIQAIGILEI